MTLEEALASVRTCEPMTHAAIARAMRLPKVTVQRIERRAIAKLARRMEEGKRW